MLTSYAIDTVTDNNDLILIDSYTNGDHATIKGHNKFEEISLEAYQVQFEDEVDNNFCFIGYCGM